MSKIKTYIKSILVPVIVGGVVGIIISKFMDYNTLEKPFLSPSSIAFPIVWTILYILMGISYGRLKEKNLNDTNVKTIYYLQLFVNALWSIIFFVFKLRLLAFAWIILLDILVFVMINIFYSKDRKAGLLQIPYLIWTLFATYLNLFIYILNK